MRLSTVIALLPVVIARPVERPEPALIPRAAAQEIPIVVIDIGDPTLDAGFRWESETVGRLLLALDANLSSLHGVVPRIGDAPRPPSLRDLPNSMKNEWVGAIQSSGDSDDWTVSMALCPDGEACFHLEQTGSADAPEAIAAALATNAAGVLSRPHIDFSAEPPSTDTYAALIAGRGAATFYGLLPATDPDNVGVPRRDPAARAVLIDPGMSNSQWLLGRHLLAHGQAEGAVRAFTRAGNVATAPQDRATALAAAGRWTDSRDAWSATLAEPRFAITAAAVSVHLQDDVTTDAWLALVPAGTTADPELLRLLANRAGNGVTEDLLERWATADKTDPEPVRRRVHLLSRHGQYQAARDLVSELARRGGADAEALGLALDAELGLETPIDIPDEHEPIEMKLERARAAGRRGDWAAARPILDDVLRMDPWSPEALALQVDALMAANQRDAARETLATLRAVDPSWGREGMPWR